MLRKVGPNEVLRCKIGTGSEATIFPWDILDWRKSQFGFFYKGGYVGSMFASICIYLGLFLLAYVFFLDSSAIPSNPKRLGSAPEMVFLSTRNRISVMQADAMKSSRCSAHPRGNSWEGRDTMIVLKKGGGLLQSDVLGIFAKGLLISDHILRTCVGASQESGQGKPCR